MNLRRLRWKNVLLGIVLPSILLASLYTTIRLRQNQPRILIVGKWRSTSDPTWRQNQTYEFFPDGRYIGHVRELTFVNPTNEVWVDYDYYGHYQLSPKNELTLTYQGGDVSGMKLHFGHDEITVGGHPTEHWRRIKP